MSRKRLLPESAVDRMGTLLDAIQQADEVDEGWRADTRIHVLRNYTTEPLDPYLKFHLLRDDIRPEISHGGYGTIAQELLDPDSLVVKTPPDAFVLSLLVEFIDPAISDEEWTADVAMRELTTYINTLLEQTSALVITNTFIPPIDMLLSAVPVGIKTELMRLNEHLLEIAGQYADRVVVCDWRELPGLGALDTAIDKRFWRSSDAPFRAEFLDLYARRVTSYVRAVKGFAKKCLILDCDDTLWGGIVGEVGLKGLVLDDSSEPGRSFRQFQREILRLHERGVMIAICSKNNEEDVWNVFEQHESMLLSKSHLVAWRINWADKASNIDSIVAELNIGMDSVVFVDDSPRERALISDRLPEVSVIEISEGDPASPELLLRDCYFETISQTVEDASRTRMYQEQGVRSEARQRFSDLSGYLRSLQTVVRISEANEDSINRVAQLTQKTNQFNLTTRRYTEAEIRDFIADPRSAVFKMTVSDRFGDMGITAVLIANRDKTSARIDTLLLSCRVLGRQLEVAFVDQCMQILEARWPISTWHAEFIATRKNQQTEDFWDRMGFEVVGGDEPNKHYASGVDSRNVDYLDIMTVESE